MSLYKRKGSSIWWVRFTHKGSRIQQSSGTSERIKAEEYEAKLRSSLWEQERLGAKPIYTWNDAVVRYLSETKHKATQGDDIQALRWLDRYLNGVELQTINGICWTVFPPRNWLQGSLMRRLTECWQ